MKIQNKIILFLVAFLLIFSLCSLTYATEQMNNVGNDVKNATENAGNTIKDGAMDAGGAIKKMENATNDVKNTMDNSGNSTSENLTGDYNTTRTTAEDTTATATNDATMWMWIMLAVVAVLIIGLVWYYASQTNNNRH